MPKEFRLPSLGENVTEATIGKILVKVGDTVHKGISVLEIETDKAVAEIPAAFDGRTWKFM
jgi:pyruvate dehydrogenase E2 component (dihydrolipoamide acetyltransferase)